MNGIKGSPPPIEKNFPAIVLCLEKVLDVNAPSGKCWMDITIGGDDNVSTKNHIFFSRGYCWVSSYQDLPPSDGCKMPFTMYRISFVDEETCRAAFSYLKSALEFTKIGGSLQESDGKLIPPYCAGIFTGYGKYPE